MRFRKLLPLLLLSACTAETGILVSVSGSAIDVLEFYVGVEEGGQYILDRGVSGTRVDVSGRNLSVTPYELLLEPSGGGGLGVRVLALGKRRGDNNSESLYSFAFTQTPQRFIEGEVLRRTLSLNTINGNRWVRSTGACQRIAFSAEDRYVLYPVDDMDCDGHGTKTQHPPDCADDDPSVFPGAYEYCDGKDTDCDGSYAAARVRCYDVDASANCFAGMRDCKEQEGSGPSGECVLEGAPVAQAYCAAYTACQSLDPLLCARAVPVSSYGCTLKMKDELQSCGEGGSVELAPPTGTEVCQWRLVQSGGFKVEFINQESQAVSVEAVEACKPLLRVRAHGESPETGTVLVEFFAEGKPGWVRRFEITQLDDPTCEAPILSCERQ